jgi:hypothetical protein
VIYDLYTQGILSFSSLIYSLIGVALLLSAGIALFKLKVSISLLSFSGVFAFFALLCVLMPPVWWLKVFVFLLFIFFATGLFIGFMSRRANLPNARLSYRHSPSIAFVGIDDAIEISIVHDKKFQEIAHRFMDRYCDLDIDGIDSPHCESVLHNSRIPMNRNGNIIDTTLPVSFILRGHDEGSILYCSLALKKPWSYLIPWRQRLTLRLPSIPVLSSTFAPLAGKPLNIPREEKLTRHATEKISRLRTEAFLHIAPYTPGEPLSQIDFKSSLRAGEIVSRKYARTIDLNCLIALGFGRRAHASSEGERLVSELGTVLSENVSQDIASDVAIFDTIKNSHHKIGRSRQSALAFGRQIAPLQPSHYEEDEYSIVEGLGLTIRDYTHLKIIVAWGGQFDISRALHASEFFRKNGTVCEIRVIAREVFALINGQKGTEPAKFFLEIMNRYTEQARSSGVRLVWLAK